MRAACSEDGQATVEFVALVAILTLVFVAATAVVAGGAPNIVNAFLGQMRQALCIVTGGACTARRQQPCVVSSDRRTRHAAVSIAIIRVDRDRIILRENMSDGTVRLTLARRTAAGIEVGAGARGQVRLKGRAIGSSREARIGAQGLFGYGEVFVARNAREADAIVRKLLRPRLLLVDGLPSPREVFAEGGIRGLGRLGLGSAFAGASLDGKADGILAVRSDTSTGEVTLSLNVGNSGWALLSGLAAGLSRSSDRSVGLDVKLDRRGRPLQLTLKSSGNLGAGVALGPSLPGRQGFSPTQVAGGATGDRRWEIEASLDLLDPVVAAAWSAFRRDRDDADAIGELAAQLRERAQIDVRSYALRGTSVGLAAGVALALKIGAEAEISIDGARLLLAESRPPGGLWERRIDCGMVLAA